MEKVLFWIRQSWQTLVHRWKNTMPKFFKWMFGAGCTMSGTAIAVQEALTHYNIEPDEWWTVAYKYLIGIGVGMATASKFTQKYSGSPVGDDSREKEDTGRTVLDRDIDTLDGE